MMHDGVARFQSRVHGGARLLGLLLLAGLHPACYSSSGKTYMAPGAPGGPGVLFSDNFVVFPGGAGSNWTAPSMATVAVTNPLPNYYLTMVESSRPGSTSTTTTMSFTTQTLTFQVDVLYSAASLSTDTAQITIVDGSNATLAQATLDASTGMISFAIGGTALTSATVSTGVFTPVIFSVNGSTNMATWTVGSTTTASVAFGPTTTKLQLGVSYAATIHPAPTFEFTNVSISDP